MSENNIIIRIQGETQLQNAESELDELLDKNRQLLQSMRDNNKERDKETAKLASLKARLDENIAILREQVKDEVKLGKAIAQLTKEYTDEAQAIHDSINAKNQENKALKDTVKSNEKSIDSLKQSIRQYNLLTGATGKARTQLMEMNEVLLKMAESGDTTSATFIAMAEKAAELNDASGDARQIVALLASDTKNLDAAMQVGGGLAGAFNAATSAMALLGGESEELQEAFLKVQAAMAILNGLQQVMAVADKRSAANVVLRTALLKLFNREKIKEARAQLEATAAGSAHAGAMTADAVATKAATAATGGFTAALLANPVTLIVAALAALVGGLAFLVSSIRKSKEEQRDFNGVMERTKTLIEDTKNQSDYAARLAEAEGKNWKTVAKIQENGLMQQRNAAVRAYNEMVRKKQAANGRISEEEQALLDEMREMWQQFDKDIQAHRQDVHVREVAEITQQNEEKRKAWAAAAQRRREEIKQAQEDLNQVTVELMEEGMEKEIEQINLNFKNKIANIKGNSKTEIALRKKLEEQRSKEIKAVKKKLAEQERAQEYELSNKQLETDLALANALEKDFAEDTYEIKKETLEKRAKLQKLKAKEEIKDAELLKETLLQIDAELTSQFQDLVDNHTKAVLEQKYAQKENEIALEENYAMYILNQEDSTNEQIAQAREVLANHEDRMRALRLQKLEEEKEAKIITEEQYQAEKLAIERETLEKERELMEMSKEQVMQLTQEILSFAGDLASEIFGAISDHLSSEMEALDEMYTTDAEEAKENANKKYISEKELNDKKIALKRKQAAIDKASALFSIGLNTAMGIMSVWADPTAVWAMKIALTTMVGALGATQLAIAAAKPLPQYAKGRKGGKGEYALVGEKGPEVMYIPAGASIVPNSLIYSPDKWDRFGVPTIAIPPMPQVESFSELAWRGMPFDYERFGKTMRNNMPEQKMIHINIDRSGVTVQSGNDTHTYMNTKYTGTWN